MTKIWQKKEAAEEQPKPHSSKGSDYWARFKADFQDAFRTFAEDQGYEERDTAELAGFLEPLQKKVWSVSETYAKESYHNAQGQAKAKPHRRGSYGQRQR
jgi:hypothetical protein